MDYPKLFQVLMKWGLENMEWDMVLYLYTDMYVGIPNRYLYSCLPKKKKDLTLTELLGEDHQVLSSNGTSLLQLFPQSRWVRLTDFTGI